MTGTVGEGDPPETGTITVNGAMVPFIVERSHRRKRTIAFKMGGDARLRVIVPASARMAMITQMVQSHAPWVARKLKQVAKCSPLCAYTDGALFSYMGFVCRLHVTQGEDRARRCVLHPHALHVHVPDATLSMQGLQDEVRLEIALWLKKRARAKLKKRLDLWASRLGVSYQKLIVSEPERRWGSCSADNVIRLNMRLMHAPLSVIDYVVAHELCHVRQKNHSPRFWGFLEKSMPDWRHRRKILRELEASLMV